MKSHSFRTFALLGALGVLSAACSDEPTQLRPQQPTIPKPAFSVDLTSAGGPTTVNTALWWTQYTFPAGSVGTGNLKPFLRIQNSPHESGFNNDNNPAGEDADGSWTKSLPLNRVPEFAEPGQPGRWREFFLDANEANSTPDALFSMDTVNVWICHKTGSNPDPKTYTRAQFTAAQGGDCQPVWAIGPSRPILATDKLTSGSGGGDVDYRFLIDHLRFGQTADDACTYTGAGSTFDCGYYVILDAQLGYTGGNYVTGATFEEFSTLDRPVPGTLQIVKRVVNDNGGTATVTNFNITSSGGTLNFGAGVADGTSTLKYSSQIMSLDSGTYTMIEGAVAGYTNGTWSCTGNPAISSASDAGLVLVATGDTVVCTITNNDKPPKLVLDKITSYSNGGTQPESGWTLSADGPGSSDISGAGAAGHADVVSGASLVAGTYALSETGTYAGYQNGTTFSCSKNGGGAVSGNSITLAVGDSALCSITNTDIGPKLVLDKITSYTHGGTRSEADWTLSADGPGASDFSGPGASGHADVVSGAIVAGTYALSETGSYPGYTNGTTFSCSKNGGGAVSGNSITLAVGDSALCSITNTDVAPKLVLDKITSYTYGGTQPESGWTLSADGPGSSDISGAGASGHADVVSGASLVAGTYALSETGTFAGYTNGTTFSCSKNSGGAVSGNSITLAVGDSALCSITNVDKPAKLVIVKSVKGASSTFTFNTTGSGLTNPFTLTPPADGADSTAFGGLSAGSYSVFEVIPGGYTLTGLACSTGGTTDYPTGSTASITLAPGDSVRCAFENTQNSGVTRTQGFWATHLTITQDVWNGGSVGGNTWPGLTDAAKTLCVAPLTVPQVMGGFWSNIAKTTTGSKRSDLDQARMQLLQQLLAAILNHAAFGSSPTGPISIAAATSAFCGTDITAIKNAQAAMAAFNTSGDSGLFTPGVSANSKDARALADQVFWNILPK